MPSRALHVHDAGLRWAVASSSGRSPKTGIEVSEPSPGYALMDGDRPLVGAVAEARSRLLPRNVHHRFWDELSLDPLPQPFPAGWRTADLAHAHLEAICKGALRSGAGRSASAGSILAVPGDWAHPRLALLLGVARSLGLPAAALVDAGVASLAGAAEEVPAAGPESAREESGDPAWRDAESFLHLDLHLHRAVVTRVGRHASLLYRRSCRPIPGMGLVTFRQRWLAHVASRFLRETRFDPLHRGEHEQELWLALPFWLERLRTEQTVEAHLDGAGDDGVTLELRRDEADSVTEDLLEEVRRGCGAADSGTVLTLSATAASVPGLAERLGDGFGGVVRLPARAAAMGALAVAGALGGARELDPVASEVGATGVGDGEDGVPYLDHIHLSGGPRERDGTPGDG